ncbi:IS21 family transposase [Salinactinospora qingdaonensis]|uniref:IS21 family transposase n=1 Tax=Salinactinospora qingdaonensis TaxID=702744 RepID=UPI0031EE9511
MITVEDWAEIRRLRRSEDMPIQAIARHLGIARNTVKRALASENPPKYERAARGSIVDEVEPRIRELLEQWPAMPATVIAERIGWQRSLTVLKDRVRRLRPLYQPVDPASRTIYRPGELAQCDLWFPSAKIPLGTSGHVASPPVLVMVSGYSRWLMARMLPSRQAADLVSGHWHLLQGLGGAPKRLVWDNESGIGRWGSKTPRLTEEFAAFRGSLGIGVVVCRPRDPEAKGLVERANGYLETSFLPGRGFSDPADFNTQLTAWLGRANRRYHRGIGCRPADRVGTDLAAMAALPPLAPRTGWRSSLRLPRDHYVRLDTVDYSVHPRAIGRRVEVTAGLERVQIFCQGDVVGDHERCWAPHQTITAAAHAEAAAGLRRAARTAAAPAAGAEVAVRDLADYDRMLGIEEVA